jgi:UTP-glucose-1-phosphate uridylyltransferase
MENSNQDATLVILAAGLGSRYNGQKQLDSIGFSGESLMEFALYDAIQLGFTKVVFVINNLFDESNRSYFLQIGQQNNIKTYFVCQEITSDVPNEYLKYIAHRKKPWGTAHAILLTKQVVQEPFVVINADDFYGRKAYEISKKAIAEATISNTHFAMVGYPVDVTLSENGPVSRGVCTISSDDYLEKVTEQTHIIKKGNVIVINDNDTIIDSSTIVSMNFWVFHPAIFDYLEEKFKTFISNNYHDIKKEFYIPQVVDELIQSQKIKLKVEVSSDSWFGVTYPDDKNWVVTKINELIRQNKYPKSLWR